MSNVTLFGFPRSTFVKVCGLILTARNVDYDFHDTEDEMYLPVWRFHALRNECHRSLHR
jgi:hypothetical protein